MSGNPMDDFDRLFDLPKQVDELLKKIGALEKQGTQQDPSRLVKAVWDSVNSAGDQYLKPALGAASDACHAANRFDEAGKVRLIQRRKLFAAWTTLALFATFASGYFVGFSPTLTKMVLHSESGCEWFGGKLMATKSTRTSFCAFEVGAILHRS